MTHEILIVEPDSSCAMKVKGAVSSQETHLEHVDSYERAMKVLAATPKDLVLSEMLLGEKSGVELCRWLRGRDAGSETLVVFLSSLDRESDRIKGLEAGATDYVTKPFSGAELKHRVRAILRRSRAQRLARATDSGGNDADEEHSIVIGGRKLELSRNEYRLFEVLRNSNGRVLNRRQLVEAIWGVGSNVQERSVDAHVKGLRKRLSEYHKLIETVHGVGYRLAKNYRKLSVAAE